MKDPHMKTEDWNPEHARDPLEGGRVAELESQLDAHEGYNAVSFKPPGSARCPTCGKTHYTLLEDKRCQTCADRGRIEKLEGEIDSLMKFRRDVTSAAIHAHDDNAGGLRYDEVADAIKRLGKIIKTHEQTIVEDEDTIMRNVIRIEKLEAKLKAARTANTAAQDRIVVQAKRIEELETAIREIAEEERAFMSDPIGEAGVTHRKAAIARKLFYQKRWGGK